MWLINCSNYRLEPNDLESPQSRPYWILSHTWGDDEVTFQDMQRLPRASMKKGFRKIRSMCKLALDSEMEYVWIDTCCIDKSSSAELSESINSMFYWYQKSERCVAFLQDLEPGERYATENELRGCRWFTRGWTLQELLAPSRVDFYDSQWNPRGSKEQLCRALSNITNIRCDILVHPKGANDDILQTVTVATKMSWAANRQTTRIEDKAYCLLGIFGVHMPLLYGERGQAFIRLQQAIAQNDNDMSLFAWIAESGDEDVGSTSPTYSGILASDPSQFATCAEVSPIRDPLLPSPSWILTNAGIEMTTALDHSMDPKHSVIARLSNGTVQTVPYPPNPRLYRLFLHCRITNSTRIEGSAKPKGLAIWLRKTSWGFVRYHSTELCLVEGSAMRFGDPQYIRVSTSLTRQQYRDIERWFSPYQDQQNPYTTLRIVRQLYRRDAQIEFTYHPAHLWDGDQIYFSHTADSPLPGILDIRLVEITVSNRPRDAPFSQTCWVFCGVSSTSGCEDKSTPSQTTWVEVVCEDPGGDVAIFGKQASCQTKDFRNPFALSSVLCKLQALGIRPELQALQTRCLVRCTPAIHFEIGVSKSMLEHELMSSRPSGIIWIWGSQSFPTVDQLGS